MCELGSVEEERKWRGLRPKHLSFPKEQSIGLS